MDSYSTTLKAYLAAHKQDDLASSIGKTQGAISRYASGVRTPDAETARAIDAASGGVVPYRLWEAETLRRLGIEQAA